MSDEHDTAQRPSPEGAAAPPEQPEEPANVTTLPPSPMERIRATGRLSSDEQWAVVRELLHPMVMQRLSNQTIAEEFGRSVDTVSRWRGRLRDELRHEAVNMQARDFIMESVSSLRMARAEAWKGHQAAETDKDKRAYLGIIGQVEGQFGKMGERIGLYGGRHFQPMEPRTYGENGENDAARGAEVLKEMVKRLFSECPDAEDADDFPLDDEVKDLDGEEFPDSRQQEEEATPSTGNILDDIPEGAIKNVRRRRPPRSHEQQQAAIKPDDDAVEREGDGKAEDEPKDLDDHDPWADQDTGEEIPDAPWSMA